QLHRSDAAEEMIRRASLVGGSLTYLLETLARLLPFTTNGVPIAERTSQGRDGVSGNNIRLRPGIQHVLTLRNHLVAFAHQQTCVHPIVPRTIKLFRRTDPRKYRGTANPNIQSLLQFGLDQLVRLTPIHQRCSVLAQLPVRHRLYQARLCDPRASKDAPLLVTITPIDGLQKAPPPIIQ